MPRYTRPAGFDNQWLALGPTGAPFPGLFGKKKEAKQFAYTLWPPRPPRPPYVAPRTLWQRLMEDDDALDVPAVIRSSMNGPLARDLLLADDA